MNYSQENWETIEQTFYTLNKEIPLSATNVVYALYPEHDSKKIWKGKSFDTLHDVILEHFKILENLGLIKYYEQSYKAELNLKGREIYDQQTFMEHVKWKMAPDELIRLQIEELTNRLDKKTKAMEAKLKADQQDFFRTSTKRNRVQIIFIVLSLLISICTCVRSYGNQ